MERDSLKKLKNNQSLSPFAECRKPPLFTIFTIFVIKSTWPGLFVKLHGKHQCESVRARHLPQPVARLIGRHRSRQCRRQQISDGLEYPASLLGIT
jgi:hypothetical protein